MIANFLLLFALLFSMVSASAKSLVRPNGRAVHRAATRMVETAKAAGVSKSQFKRFIKVGVVLQERQWAASAAARKCDVGCQCGLGEGEAGCSCEIGPDKIGYGGARGGGKSHWLLAQMAVDDCQRCPGLKCLLLRKSGKAIKEQIRDNLRILVGIEYSWTPSDGLGVIEFPNGARIILGHFKDDRDIDSYLGLEYDVIGIEEATTLSKSKIDDILTCLRTSKPNWRPRAYFTTNPGNIGHAWFKAMFVDPAFNETETDTRFVSATVDDNAFVNAGYKKQLDRLTGWKLKAWRYGDWNFAAGQFFTTFRAEHEGQPHHVKVLDELPTHWRVWLAMDYGFTHYTVIYLMAQDDDGNVWIVDEHAEQRWLIPRHVQALHAMLARNNVTRARLATFVAGHDVFSPNESGETIADKWAAFDFPLLPANIDRMNGWAEILARLGDADAEDKEGNPTPIAPRLFITKKCPRLIECLPVLQHNPKRVEDVLKVDTNEDGEGGDDTADAARYGVMEATSLIAVTDETLAVFGK